MDFYQFFLEQGYNIMCGNYKAAALNLILLLQITNPQDIVRHPVRLILL